MLGQHGVSADEKKMKVERFICKQHNGRAKESLQKVFFVFFFCKPRSPRLFFLYVKLLISLLNGALFRLGQNFGLRPYGAKFFPRVRHQLLKHMVGTPHGKAGLGNYENWNEMGKCQQL